MLSVVVVVHDMARELPRTLRTIGPGHQRHIGADDYEVIVVDNGSSTPVDPKAWEGLGLRIRLLRIDDAPPSPARAANLGIEAAAGEVIGLIVDGARMASPGLLSWALAAHRLVDGAVVTAPAYHLGTATHMEAATTGHDQAAEDALLDGLGWEEDGYRLFSASTLGGSSGRGWFGPMGESSSLFLRAATWRELGGLDERFVLPGGGLANHDLYDRACALDGATLVVLLGEGTFHQFHRGAATSGRFGWEEMDAEYQAIRGRPYRPPANDPILLGRLPPAALDHLARSTELAVARRERATGSTR